MPLGAVIDDQSNSYISADRGIYKLSPDGKLLWQFMVPPPRELVLVPNGCSIYEGMVIFDTTDGRWFSLDMETGRVIWQRKVNERTCTDTGVVSVFDGVAIAESDGPDIYGLCSMVTAVNVTDGELLWKYKPDDALWDLMAQSLSDGTFVFQDISGKVYRNFVHNGTNLWKNGGESTPSWTDGTQGVGPNGVVYAVSLLNTRPGCIFGIRNAGGSDCPGRLSAYKISDGTFLWSREVPRPPNSSPVVGRLGSSDRLSVVIPVGQQPSCEPAFLRFFTMGGGLLSKLLQLLPEPIFTPVQQGVGYGLFYFVLWLGDRQQAIFGNPDAPTDIYAFDAETGDPQWHWKGPTYHRIQCPADERGLVIRSTLGMRTASCPTPWGAPRIGADGTLYAGNMNGHFYALRDVDGDGRIDAEKGEVSDFDCGAEFTSIGSAHAPGMIVMASATKVYAFKT